MEQDKHLKINYDSDEDSSFNFLCQSQRILQIPSISDVINTFKKPKLFPINRNVEDFESFESGSKKTLKEFQNLYMHRFSDINSYRNKLKKSLNSSTLKQKLEKNIKGLIITPKIK